MITADQIIEAKKRTKYRGVEAHHEHDDCIRIAYAWFDAQNTVKSTSSKKFLQLKHLIERWAGRYVSTADVLVAAELHPNIDGTYPDFNLSRRLVLPSERRLDSIPEARAQGYRERFDASDYKLKEDGVA